MSGELLHLNTAQGGFFVFSPSPSPSNILPSFAMQLYKVLFLGLSLLLGVGASAQTGDAQRQNLHKVPARYESGRYRLVSTESYKLPKSELMARYAFNDTARALVNLYFERHAEGRIFSGVTLATTALVHAAGKEEPPLGQDYATITYKPWTYPALGVAVISCIAGFVHQSNFDRKSLVEKLIEYEGTRGLDKKTRRKLRPRHFKA
ncbi:MAG: hypothetical protein AVDCRST_MAG56-4527 [uncultured Cytophagales bacterium]|uniref:Uncharacterized protein n=1 Tax=uncultured Cytophagales bacterium TaxID=158755 RepID=A0A6J4JW18_9SPHI|nr:MAG: hypothetical protein AVDCRST_MAG56-4527 [uncultured Cytophagales bacterium]